MDWRDFDADRPSLAALDLLASRRSQILAAGGVDEKDAAGVSTFIASALTDYESGRDGRLNRAFNVQLFRPHEFDHIQQNDESLAVFRGWLVNVEFDWRGRSDGLKRIIREKWPAAGATKIAGGREYVDLDGLVIVAERRVAFEVEASNNLDNGYFTLRQANRHEISDYGLMVVPWSSNRSRADEGRSLGRLDREFDDAAHLADGPIYRLAVMRDLDALRLSSDRAADA